MSVCHISLGSAASNLTYDDLGRLRGSMGCVDCLRICRERGATWPPIGAPDTALVVFSGFKSRRYEAACVGRSEQSPGRDAGLAHQVEWLPLLSEHRVADER